MKAEPSQSADPTRPVIDAGWNRQVTTPSLPEAHSSIPVAKLGVWRKLLAFSGPGLLVAVGYMDPGNWATDLEGGARFGYTLLSVVLISNFMAILLQHLALKLGIVSGRDLAQACRDHYSRRVSLMLWVMCEIAIAACDLAEVIGSAIAFQLLFGWPIIWGVVLTSLDVLIVLFLQHKGFRYIEFLVLTLILVIAACFAFEIKATSSLSWWSEILSGMVPRSEIVTNREMLYVAIAILGATVMPHNLYLHSSIVQTRAYERTDKGKSMAIRFAGIDSMMALMFAFFINAAILIVSATEFHGTGMQVATIQDGHLLLAKVLPGSLASTVFAFALLASGQNSTLTGTMAGQIVMEGFLDLRLRPWVRRMLTRLLAIGPAAAVAIMYGDSGTTKLLVFSQVVLSVQLSFAVIPLVTFTSDKVKMGRFVNPLWLTILAWLVAAVIVSLNLFLVFQAIFGDSAS